MTESEQLLHCPPGYSRLGGCLLDPRAILDLLSCHWSGDGSQFFGINTSLGTISIWGADAVYTYQMTAIGEIKAGSGAAIIRLFHFFL